MCALLTGGHLHVCAVCLREGGGEDVCVLCLQGGHLCVLCLQYSLNLHK